MKPAKNLFLLLWLWFALALVASIFPVLSAVWLVMGAVIMIVALFDGRTVLHIKQLYARRQLRGSLPVNVWRTIKVRVANAYKNPVSLTLYDHHPAQAESRHLPQAMVIQPDGWGEASYQVRLLRRGDQSFGATEALLFSPLRLWQRKVMLGEPQAVRGYPDFAAVAKYALLATDHHLSQMGIRKRRRRGMGLEFHQLREYRDGDTLRQVDWKATSRMNKLISREYQDERDQQIVFLFDGGRRMLAQDGALSHFDHALNAMLLLAHVALRQGDAVGMMSFAGEERYLHPKKGSATLNQLMNRLYDMQPMLKTPDYVHAVTELMKKLRKRSLVVLVTNLRDEDSEELMVALNLLKKRHLVLLASLREMILGDTLRKPVDNFNDALTLAATHHYLGSREKAFEQVKYAGVFSLDVEPAKLPVAMVNRYLEIKRSGRL